MRSRRVRRAALLAVTVAAGGLGLWSVAVRAQSPPAAKPVAASAAAGQITAAAGQVERGRRLFLEGCASCHGNDARGIAGTAPTLHGVGAASADFYLSTGRMPLNDPRDEPLRGPPRYPPDEIAALVAYVGSLGGPPIPSVDPARGDLARGMQAFTLNCAGCHQVVAKGGIVIGGFAPSLASATPQEVAEAVRVGPYLMPMFDERRIDGPTLDSIVRYVEYTKRPRNDGGWAIGNIGPVPEGLVAWLLAGVALLGCARLIGERTDD